MASEPFILNFINHKKRKIMKYPFYYNIDTETNVPLKKIKLLQYDQDYIIYASGSRLTNARGDPTRDEETDRQWF